MGVLTIFKQALASAWLLVKLPVVKAIDTRGERVFRWRALHWDSPYGRIKTVHFYFMEVA
ncbi:hypothetical protein D1159_09230 [Pseudoflavonifractor sp. 524-17]|nr:hypothetical protein [Pseudoflavonifractor sp. 524-17]